MGASESPAPEPTVNADQRRRADRFVSTLIFWCVLGTVVALGLQRLEAEHGDRRVEIAYPESALLAQTVQDPGAPARLLASGITTLVREPYTLADLVGYKLAQAWHPEPQRLQIQLADSQLGGNAAVFLGGQLGLPNVRIRIRDNQYLFDLRLPGAEDELDPGRFILDISSGPMPAGFRRALRLPAGDWAPARDLDQFTQTIASLRPDTVLPDWRGGPGAGDFFRAYLNTPWLRAPLLAVPEFSLPPVGELVLRHAPRHYLIRAYRLSEAAFGEGETQSALVQRLVRSVSERSVRFLYLEFPPDWVFNQRLQFTRTLAQGLKNSGFEPGPLLKERRVGAGFFAQIFLFFGIGAMAYWLIWQWARWGAAATAEPESNGPVRVIRLQAKYFRLAALGLALMLMVVQSEGPAQWGAKLGAWLLAVMAPLLAVGVPETNPAPAEAWRPWCLALARDFGTMLAWCLGAALMIAMLLYQQEFVQRLNVFTGVKSAYVLPLLLATLYLFPNLTSRRWWQAQFRPPHLWRMSVWILLAAAALGILLLRTGNLTWFPGKAWEMRGRDALECFFGVRPRFKEFLLGYPLLLLGLGARRLAAHRTAVWPKLCLLAGLLGPMSLINSFCHLHTPLLVSLLRSFHGLWLGMLLGGAALALLWQRHARRSGPAQS